MSLIFQSRLILVEEVILWVKTEVEVPFLTSLLHPRGHCMLAPHFMVLTYFLDRACSEKQLILQFTGR